MMQTLALGILSIFATLGILVLHLFIQDWLEIRRWEDWAKRQQKVDEEFERRRAAGEFVSKLDRQVRCGDQAES